MLAETSGSLLKSPVVQQQQGWQSSCGVGCWLWTDRTSTWEAPASPGPTMAPAPEEGGWQGLLQSVPCLTGKVVTLPDLSWVTHLPPSAGETEAQPQPVLPGAAAARWDSYLELSQVDGAEWEVRGEMRCRQSTLKITLMVAGFLPAQLPAVLLSAHPCLPQATPVLSSSFPRPC